jgi:phage terminase large subunit-like protein
MPHYEPSKRRITWPNGARATLFSADKPDRLRGPQHDAAWCDELAAWQYPEAWDMLALGLRLGDDPRTIVTTTPKPSKLIRKLVADPSTVVTHASTFANRAFLAPQFIAQILAQYEGTRLGRQELMGELLEDIEGALWRRDNIDGTRLLKAPDDLLRIVVAIDPAATSGENADETGILVVGRDAHPLKPHGYVLEDLSGRYTPEEWSKVAVRAYHRWHADKIVAEVNNGGDMVERVLRVIDPSISYRKVHATRGKVIRAEPAAALYEQARVHHCGRFDVLEDQQCNFTVDLDRKVAGSPDRVDALVWALFDLLVKHRPQQQAVMYSR